MRRVYVQLAVHGEGGPRDVSRSGLVMSNKSLEAYSDVVDPEK